MSGQSPEKDAACVHGVDHACLSFRCGSNCSQEYDRMHPCPACAAICKCGGDGVRYTLGAAPECPIHGFPTRVIPPEETSP